LRSVRPTRRLEHICRGLWFAYRFNNPFYFAFPTLLKGLVTFRCAGSLHSECAQLSNRQVTYALYHCREDPSYLAAADEYGCCIVGQIRTSAEVPDIPDEAVDACPWPLKVCDEAILAILLLCVVRGFGDAVGIKQ